MSLAPLVRSSGATAARIRQLAQDDPILSYIQSKASLPLPAWVARGHAEGAQLGGTGCREAPDCAAASLAPPCTHHPCLAAPNPAPAQMPGLTATMGSQGSQGLAPSTAGGSGEVGPVRRTSTMAVDARSWEVRAAGGRAGRAAGQGRQGRGRGRAGCSHP